DGALRPPELVLGEGGDVVAAYQIFLCVGGVSLTVASGKGKETVKTFNNAPKNRRQIRTGLASPKQCDLNCSSILNTGISDDDS
ncbi:MAG: hypothetical protein ABSA72_12250, partial [Nitrososphaerales archaeon]